MQLKIISVFIFVLLILSGCTGEKKDSETQSSMKCGPGKCGASMVDGSSILVKKKMNILNQLKEDDDRRTCVLDALTTKDLYNCVRVADTGRLSTKCASDNTQKIPHKEVFQMKCEAGKCGSSM